ncbi:MAG: hypothetical protein ACJAWL_001761 [Motiliproteus sp.]|jgi:hypothetical protein
MAIWMRLLQPWISSLMRKKPVTLATILDPAASLAYDGKDWYQLVSQARTLKLLPYLKLQFERQGLWELIPPGPKLHMHSAWIHSNSIYYASRWELEKLTTELQGIRWMPLKGAAYSLIDLPHSRYRLTGDVDVLVNRNTVDKAEMLLKIQGWRSEPLNDYDSRYYRQWSHEVPPMKHPERGSVLDLHHNLYPLVSSTIRVNIAAFWQGAQRHKTGVSLPCLEDLFLHSALHLFMQEEFSSALRDLVDMGEIYHQGCEDNIDYPAALQSRAKRLGLERPCWFAVRYLNLFFHKNIPVTNAGGMNFMSAWCYDWLFVTTFFDLPHEKSSWYLPIARKLLEARGHWVKMSLPILSVHLWHKLKVRYLTSRKQREA